MAKQIISGSEVKAGQRLFNEIDGGLVGDVIAVRPYTGPLISLLGEGTQIGEFAGGMQMTLPANRGFEVRA